MGDIVLVIDVVVTMTATVMLFHYRCWASESMEVKQAFMNQCAAMTRATDNAKGMCTLHVCIAYE